MLVIMNIKTVELNYDKTEDGINIRDITRQIEHSIIETKMSNGIATIFAESPATSISTMEYEPGMISDVKNALGKLMPNGDANHYGRSGNGANGYHNGHTNGHANGTNGQANGPAGNIDARPSIIGPSITVPFKDNRLMVGKWQQIVLINFANEKRRTKVVLQIMGE